MIVLHRDYGFYYPYGTLLRKKRGSQWRGKVVGYYSTTTTPMGYCIESLFEPGSVQVWPNEALELWDGKKENE